MPIPLPVIIVNQEERVQQDQLRVHRVVQAQSLLLLHKRAVIVLKASTVAVKIQSVCASNVQLDLLVRLSKVDRVYPAYLERMRTKKDPKFANRVKLVDTKTSGATSRVLDVPVVSTWMKKVLSIV